MVRLKLLARRASVSRQVKALADRLARPWALGGFAFLVGVGSPVEAPAKWCVWNCSPDVLRCHAKALVDRLARRWALGGRAFFLGWVRGHRWRRLLSGASEMARPTRFGATPRQGIGEPTGSALRAGRGVRFFCGCGDAGRGAC